MRLRLLGIALLCICTFILSLSGFNAARAEEKSAPPQAAAASSATKTEDISGLMQALKKQSQRLSQQEEKLNQHERELDNQRRAFAQEKIQFQKLLMQASALTGTPVAALVNKQPNAGQQGETVQGDPGEVGIERRESTEKPPEIAAVIEEGGVLLQKGKVVITPAMEYTHSSATRVSIEGFSIIPAVNIGLFDISRVSRDIMTASVGARYGVTNRIELEAKVPYVYRRDSTSTRPIGIANAPESLSNVSSYDIGDIEIGAHYQVNKGEGGWPYFIANMRLKSTTGTSPFEVPVVNGIQTELPTGSGFWAIQPSVTAIYPSDPVVYYSNLGYLHSFEESFANYGTIQPGDGISLSFGMSLALNDKASFSTGYSHTTVMRTKINGSNVPNSPMLQVGSLDLGYSYAVSDRTSLNFTVGAGLTEDAPDVRFVFRVPMTFDTY